MKVEVKDLSSVKKEISVVVPKDIIDEKFDSAYKKIGKNAKIKGFRAGKAPRHLVQRSYKGAVIQDLFQEIINETYYKALTEQKILPVSSPQISPKELEEGKDFEYTAVVEVKPELKSVKYTGLKVQKEKLIITDEDVTKQIDNLRNQHATVSKVEDPDVVVEKGHLIKMDFEGFNKDGSPLENGKGQDQMIEVGAYQLIKSLEDGLVGLKLNEEKTVEAVFPDDYMKKELQGAKIDFKVKVKEISKKDLPELNDEFAKNLKEYESLEDLKDKTKKNIESHKQSMIDYKLRQEIANAIIEENDFEVPDSIVKEQKNRLVSEANMRLAYIGKENLEKYIEDNDSEFNKQANSNVKLFFIFEEIAKSENIEISDEDIDNELKKMAENSPQSYDEIKAYYKKHSNIEDLKYRIKEDKIYDLIISKSKVTEIKPEKE